MNHLDTAYAYGRDGESERRVARAIRGHAGPGRAGHQGGRLLGRRRQLATTGRPELLRRHFEESLRAWSSTTWSCSTSTRPADDAPLAESAGMFRELLAEGKTRAVGVSNLSVDQIEAFAAECPFAACQVRYNLLQREIEAEDPAVVPPARRDRRGLRAVGARAVDGQVHPRPRLRRG